MTATERYVGPRKGGNHFTLLLMCGDPRAWKQDLSGVYGINIRLKLIYPHDRGESHRGEVYRTPRGVLFLMLLVYFSRSL